MRDRHMRCAHIYTYPERERERERERDTGGGAGQLCGAVHFQKECPIVIEVKTNNQCLLLPTVY